MLIVLCSLFVHRDMFDEKTIQDALNQFFCSEKIEYKCEKCSSQTASVKHELVKLPR